MAHFHWFASSLVAGALMLAPVVLRAQTEPTEVGDSPTEDAPTEDSPTEDSPTEDEPAPADTSYETTVRTVPPSASPELDRHRSTTIVEAPALRERQPRSAPDAVRFEPGVYVQQSAQGQGSPYIRGLTGQQTLMLFDGIRVNNSTMRQGPNQYFFTIDRGSLAGIQVMRGGGSTRYGSDAMGGVLLALPLQPTLRPDGSTDLLTYRPAVFGEGGTADHLMGGRAQLNLTVGPDFALVGGFGGRAVNNLQGSLVYNRTDLELAEVPYLQKDMRTMRGTGFQEIAGDVAAVYRINSHHQLKAATYLYRQFNLPRADRCPGVDGDGRCAVFEEQFRTLVYAAWEATSLGSLAETLRLTASWQLNHERLNDRRPAENVELLDTNDVDSMGLNFSGRTRPFAPTEWLRLRFEYGADSYFDVVSSQAFVREPNLQTQASRGRYLDGATYLTGGAFTNVGARLWDAVTFRGGARIGWAHAAAPRDTETASAAVDSAWLTWAANAGVEVEPLDWMAVFVNVDRSFRAPNIDDLTARQSTGPGFQLENPELIPESSFSAEIGARLTGPLVIQLWGYRTGIDNRIARKDQPVGACPPSTPQCNENENRFSLINSNGTAEIYGVESLVDASFPFGLSMRATVAFAWGEGPNPDLDPLAPDPDAEDREPLSRIPPVNGTVELRWMGDYGLGSRLVLRWAGAQGRLSSRDLNDARIPDGGTPSHAVIDASLLFHYEDWLQATLTMENVLDTGYRYHGSAVNGAGRGLLFALDIHPWWD